METNSRFKKEKKILFGAIGYAWLMFLLLVIFLAVPFTKKLYTSKDELELEKLTLNEIKNDFSQQDKYKNLRESIDKSKALLETAILKESTVVTFIESLERTAKDTGNQITIAPYTPPKQKKTATEDSPAPAKTDADKSAATSAATNKNTANENKAGQYFQLTVRGGYSQLLSYLAKLESMGYLFKIESLDAKTSAGVNNVSLVNLQDQGKEEDAGPLETKIIISFSLQK